jgi:hypothetical protein
MNKILSLISPKTTPQTSPIGSHAESFVVDFERCVYPTISTGARAPVIPPVLVYQKIPQAGKLSYWMTPRSAIKSSGPVCDCC